MQPDPTLKDAQEFYAAAYRGDMGCLKSLFDTFGPTIVQRQAVDVGNMTVLRILSVGLPAGRFEETLAQLAAWGCDLNMRDANGDTALMNAVSVHAKGAVELLVAKGVDTTLTNAAGDTAFDIACKLGNFNIAKLLGSLPDGADYPWPAKEEIAVFHRAASEVGGGDETILKLLSKYGPNIACTRNDIDEPVLIHVFLMKRETVIALLKNGADVNARRPDGDTPLICAASWGASWLLSLLLQNGADVNAQCNEGTTALMHAAKNPGHLKYLLEQGADPTLKTEDGETALDWATGKEASEELLRRALEKWEGRMQALKTKADIESLKQEPKIVLRKK